MTEILQMFQGNPMATYVGKKVEAATRPELESEDWALNLEICDIINDNDDDAKDAVRAIKKRLQQIEQDRNFLITNRTLTVLETCVNNCSRRFHVLVMTKDFIQDLVKLIGPKNNPPIDLQERVLRLIERWADAFKTQPDLGGVVTVYNELKSKGVTFPPKDSASVAPIETPQRSVPPVQASNHRVAGVRADETLGSRSHHQSSPAGGPAVPTVLAGEGYSKITQDLGVVQTSIDMLNDMMGHLESDNDEADWNLAAELSTTCRQMKDRIVELVERVANEDLTIELLRLNDDLNNIFIKYDRLVKKRSKKQASGSGIGDGGPSTAGPDSNPSKSSAGPMTRAENEMSLIDFNALDDSTSRSAVPTLAPTKVTETPTTSFKTPRPTALASSSGQVAEVLDPFDSSAVSRAMSDLESKTRPINSTNVLASDLSRMSIDATGKQKGSVPEEISSVREQDFAEIENWLKSESGPDLTSMGGDLGSLEPASMQNPEFENFIANRALVGSSNQTPAAGSQPQDTSSGKRSEPAT